eukprot:3427703-Rhodomonas_salina.1
MLMMMGAGRGGGDRRVGVGGLGGRRLASLARGQDQRVLAPAPTPCAPVSSRCARAKYTRCAAGSAGSVQPSVRVARTR